MGDTGERKGGGGCWPEEGLESNISGQAKAPIQAEERMWPREKSPASHSMLSFSWQPLCRHQRRRLQPCRACSLHPVGAQGMPPRSCHGHSRPFPVLENPGRSVQKAHRRHHCLSGGHPIYFYFWETTHVSQTIISEAQSLPARSSGEFCSSVDYLTLRREVFKNDRSRYL